MRHLTVQRGAVLCDGRRRWLLWVAGSVPVCMPIRSQAIPRSRWDFRLRDGDVPGLGGQALMVFGAKARAVETHGMRVIGEMTIAAVRQLETTLRRAAETTAVEAGQVIR